jgi:hypothetical protein
MEERGVTAGEPAAAAEPGGDAGGGLGQEEEEERGLVRSGGWKGTRIY